MERKNFDESRSDMGTVLCRLFSKIFAVLEWDSTVFRSVVGTD